MGRSHECQQASWREKSKGLKAVLMGPTSPFAPGGQPFKHRPWCRQIGGREISLRAGGTQRHNREHHHCRCKTEAPSEWIAKRQAGGLGSISQDGGVGSDGTKDVGEELGGKGRDHKTENLRSYVEFCIGYTKEVGG